MPQLRDSGNHSSSPLDAGTLREVHSFARIFGIETEYGVSVTGADVPCDASQTAMMMFQPIVASARSTNTYIENGSRLYLDVGSHPEYATSEACDPMDALAVDAAGELVMRDLALDAQQRLRATHGPRATVHVFKNNVDSAGHSFGCHENYLVRRFVPLDVIEHELLPFLITRQLFTGAGRVTESGFQITQRADFLDEAVSSAGREGRESGFSRFAFADAGAANRAVSRDMSGVNASFAMADGSTLQGGAVAMQERYLQAVEQFVDEHPEVASSLPRTDVHDVLRQWRNTLEAFRSGNANALGDRVDWVCKYRLFEALRARSSADLPLSKLEQLELDYHDVANGALYASLLRRGALRSLIDGREAQKARTMPPADTRAALRGRFVSAAKSHGAQYSCDWTRLSLHAPRKMDMVLLDPFQCRENEDFQAMIGALE